MDATKKGYFRVFEGEASVQRCPPDLLDFMFETKPFSPLFDESIMFYFKTRRTALNGRAIAFSLTLVRSPDSKCYPSLLMSVEVSVYYSDGSLLKKYEPQSNIKVDDLNTFNFETVENFTPSNVYNRMRLSDMSLRYRITFNDDISKTVLSKSVKSSSSKFSKNLKCAYESAVFNDFVFNVGDKTFPAHKFILVAHSPVFMKMMTQDFEESNTNSVTITDTTPEVFQMFLKYLYCGEIEDKSWPSVKDLYCLADRYDVGILKNDCTDIVVSLLSIDLVCEILKLAYIYDDSRIKSFAKRFSVNHIKQLVPRDDWKELVVAYPIIGYEVTVNFVPA